MEKLCDLHTHSIFSDGTCTPTEIIDMAIKENLSAVALCDHNTVDGLPEFLSAAEGKSIEAIAGTKLSVDYDGAELHMLALFIPQVNFSQISELMVEMDKKKEESNIALIYSLSRAGMILDYEAIKAQTPTGKVNRAHIARGLMQKGYVSSIEEAFNTHLSLTAGHYKPSKRFTVWEALDFIRSIKAVPVLAHPFLKLSKDELRKFLPSAKKQGLVGMECYYTTHDAETTETALSLAREFDLRFSGGSDFHGETKPGVNLGVGKGNLRIPYEWALELKDSLK